MIPWRMQKIISFRPVVKNKKLTFVPWNDIMFKREETQAVVAQVVAHLIGSEEVTGSTPVNSFREHLPDGAGKCFF